MKKIWLAAFLMVVLLIGAQAQQVDAFTEEASGFLGQPLTYHIVLQNFTGADLPVPQLDGFDQFSWSYQGRSSRVQSSITGAGTVRSQSVDYSYTLKPLMSGDLLIPSIEIEIDGKTYRTPSRKLRVDPPSPVQGFDFRISSDNDLVYPGMEFKLKAVWYFSGRVANPEFSIPLLGHPDIKILDPVPPQSNGADIYRFQVGGIESYAVQGTEYSGGIQYTTLSMEWTLIPRRAGLHLSGLSTLAFDQQTGTDSWMRPVYTRRMIPSNSFTIQVKDLPDNLGDAAGLIGKEDPLFQVSLSPDKGYVGDPLDLVIKIGGIFGVKDKESYPLDKMLENTGFRGSLQSLNYDAEKNVKTFKYIIRSGTAGNLEFPSLYLDYFNTNDETSHRVTSDSIPVFLESTGIDENTLVSIESNEETFEEELPVSHNETSRIILRHKNRSLTGLFHSPAGIGLIFLFCLFVAGAIAALIHYLWQIRKQKWPEEWVDLRKKYDSGSEHSAETVYRILHLCFRKLFDKENQFEGKEYFEELEKQVFSGKAEDAVKPDFFRELDKVIKLQYGDRK